MNLNNATLLSNKAVLLSNNVVLLRFNVVLVNDKAALVNDKAALVNDKAALVNDKAALLRYKAALLRYNVALLRYNVVLLSNNVVLLCFSFCANSQTASVKILLATTSQHKAREIAELLADVPDLQLETLADYAVTEVPEEDGETMQANARIKAEFYSQHFGTRVLADDSGLEVDALDGAPGVHSARWAEGSDSDRVAALLRELEGVPEEHRGARYRCALCLCDPCPAENCDILAEVEGVCEGAIHLEPRGEGGFGYDPIFEITLATGAESQWVGQTMGQVPAQVKANVSHRARAVRALAEQLKQQT